MIKRSSALLIGLGLVWALARCWAWGARPRPTSPGKTARLPSLLSPSAFPTLSSISRHRRPVKGPAGVPLPKVPKGAPFEDFFDDFFNKRGGVPHGDRKISSLGSGFVIDGKEGLIVTNNHVIEGAEEIDINFHDGSKLVVDKIIGRDTKADLALLRSRRKPLPSMRNSAPPPISKSATG